MDAKIVTETMKEREVSLGGKLQIACKFKVSEISGEDVQLAVGYVVPNT